VCFSEAGNKFFYVKNYYRESRNLEDTINYKKTKKTIWTGHILRDNCLLKHVIEEKMEGKIIVTRRRGGSYKHLLYNLKKKTEYKGSTRT
jgi:hypothetical protein